MANCCFLVRGGLLIVWLQLDVSGFRPVLACGWHGAFWMQTNGTSSPAAKQCSLASMRIAAQDNDGAPRLLYSTAVRLV